MVTKSSFATYTVNSGLYTVLGNCGYCATNLKFEHPLYTYAMSGDHSFVIGVSIGPHTCGGPSFDFGGDVDCKWGLRLLKFHLCFSTSKKHKQDYK